MSFLCPVRRKGKKSLKLGKKNLGPPLPGRITGSASVETLVRVALEKQRDDGSRQKMLVIQDFSPCVDDELAVSRGQHISVLYQENDWLYVIDEEGREGFVPFTYCLPAKKTNNNDERVSNKEESGLRATTEQPPQTTIILEEQKQITPQTNIRTHPSKLDKSASRSMPDITSGCPAPQHPCSCDNESETNVKSISQKSLSPRQNQRPVTHQEHGQRHRSTQRSLPSSSPRARSVSSSTSRSYAHHKKQSSTRSQPPLSASSQGHRIRHESRHQEHQSGTLSRRAPSVDSSKPDTTAIATFQKSQKGRYIVLFRFVGQEEGDLAVDRGDFVTVLNTEDAEWFWVKRSDGQEGFVPSNFLCAAQQHDSQSQTTRRTQQGGGSSNATAQSSRQLRSEWMEHADCPRGSTQTEHGRSSPNQTKLLCIYDFHARVPGDLSVKRGQWLIANMEKQSVKDWLWVYSISARQAGYIPRTYAKPPNFGMDSAQYKQITQHRDPFVSP